MGQWHASMENMGLNNKKILITGGLGNLGSWLTEYFCNQGCEVTVLTKRVRTLSIKQSFQIISCDIADLEDCKTKLSNTFDVIIHTASMNDNFVENYPQDALKVNALGTRNILEAIKNNPPKQFIYFSTFHVYGKYSGELTEESELNPINDYGTTHLFAEYYVKQFNKTNQIPYSIIRLSNSYGCPKDYDSSKWYLILNDLSRMAFEKQKIELKSNGLASRDFIWMGDVCKVIYQLSLLEAPNNTFNLSSGTTYSLLDVANAVQQAYQEMFEITLPVQINSEDTSIAQSSIIINSNKIKKRIPFIPESHFVEEAKNIFNFLSKNNING